MWDYLWGMTERQIELILADQPVTIYLDNDKKKHKKGAVGKEDMPVPTASKIIEAQKKWAEKYGNGGSGKIKFNFGGNSEQK